MGLKPSWETTEYEQHSCRIAIPLIAYELDLTMVLTFSCNAALKEWAESFANSSPEDLQSAKEALEIQVRIHNRKG